MKNNNNLLLRITVLGFISMAVGFAVGLTYLTSVCAGYKECSPTLPTKDHVASPSATKTPECSEGFVLVTGMRTNVNTWEDACIASPSASESPTVSVVTPTNEVTPVIVTITTSTSEVTVMKDIYELPKTPDTGRGGENYVK